MRFKNLKNVSLLAASSMWFGNKSSNLNSNNNHLIFAFTAFNMWALRLVCDKCLVCYCWLPLELKNENKELNT